MSQSQSQISPLATELVYTKPKGVADEVYDSAGNTREHWLYLLESLRGMGAQALAERQGKAQRILRDDGATYNIYNDNDSPSRTWDLDLVPLLLSSEEWGRIESGLLERAELFDALLKDIYGSRELVRHAVIPPEAIFSHAGFLRASQGLQLSGEQQLIVHAVDLIRDEKGELCVLTDRTQAPSGMGYALENRTVMSRVLPSLFRDSQVHRLAPFFQKLRQKLNALSPTDEQPLVVLLTPGAHNENYFEHAHLANYLGFPLVQSGDLVVRNGNVWMKSLDGLSRVDVILRRVDDWFCDPVELRSDSQLGIPGILEVARSGRVFIANPLGSSILENPVLLKYLPAISKAILGRELRIQSVQTYWCGDPDDLKYVSANLDALVIKPVYRNSGQHSILASKLNANSKKELLQRIHKQPNQFVAQSCLLASHLPSFVDSSLKPRPSTLRTFAVAGETSYSLMPGGLSRIGNQEGTFLISGQAASRSKDTWVIASEPERSSELPASHDATTMANESQLISLPSRVVENLFWVGRYAERAEVSLRIVRTTFMLLNGEEPISKTSRQHLLQTVGEVTATYPDFKNASDKRLANPEEELSFIVYDPQRIGSVRYSFNAMLRCVEESRELLSSDTLRVINDIRDSFENLNASLQGGQASAPEEALDPLITGLMAFSGLAHESMFHGVGWQFMEIGRRIERAFQTVNIIEQLLASVLADSDQNTLLEALLLSVEALISYRRRYRARIGIKQVLELMVLDSSNPRAILFQIERLKHHISRLPRVKPNSYELSPIERALVEAETTVQLTELNKLCIEKNGKRENLVARLTALKSLLNNISNLVSDKYFEHRIDPQQLVTRLWED